MSSTFVQKIALTRSVANEWVVASQGVYDQLDKVIGLLSPYYRDGAAAEVKSVSADAAVVFHLPQVTY